MALKKFTKAQLEKALRQGKGFVSVAAEILGCHRNTVQNYINDFPELQEVVHECRESQLDKAESILMKKIEEGDSRCLIFFLRTRGKRRGYTDRPELKHGDQPELARNKMTREDVDNTAKRFMNELERIAKVKCAQRDKSLQDLLPKYVPDEHIRTALRSELEQVFNLNRGSGGNGSH